MPHVSSRRAATDAPSIAPLDDLVAEVVTRLEAGKSIDVAALTADCPELREPLEKLLPTLAAMVDLGHAAAAADMPQKKNGAPPPVQSPSGFSPPPCGEGLGEGVRGEGPGHVAREGGAGILGDFRILNEIGRGGMGVVYEAEQISLGRRVALKVLPFAAMLDKQQLARFKNEARAAATLKHPNIVSVYSVGSERGVHYYAMELIEGNSLAEVIGAMKAGSREQGAGSVEKDQKCSRAVEHKSGSEDPTIEHQSSHERPPSALPLPPSTLAAAHLSTLHAPCSSLPASSTHEYFQSAARLGIQAAEALQHAHDLGVLHRDIKPSNLMLDAASQLYITDFGLARIEADAGVTMTGDLIGTLRYMAPEQALAKRVVIDHRADVYSLGATLYELLTLQPAFGESDRSALLKQIAFEEPRPLRKLDRRIPAELETIVLKALEKNPDERYQSAGQLADDLRAFLECRPIKAKPSTLVGLARKWSRRHKPLVTSAAVAAAAIVFICFAVLASSNMAIMNEQQKTEEALDERTVALEEKASALRERTTALASAEWNYKKALEAVDQLLARVGNEKLAEVPQLDQLRMDVLQDTLKFYESFVAKNPGDRKVQFELAKTYRRVGTMQQDFERFATATLYKDKAIAILEELRRLDPANRNYRYELGVVLTQRGWVCPTGSPGQLSFHRRAVDLLQTLCDDDPNNVTYKDALADGLRSLAECHVVYLQGSGTTVNDTTVRPVLERTFAVARLPGVNRRFLAHAHEYSGELAICENRLDDAESEYREAVRIHRLAVADRPLEGRAREHLVRVYLQLGKLFELQKDWKRAEEQYREALKFGEPLHHDFPAMVSLNFLPTTLGRLAPQVLKQQNRADDVKMLAGSFSPATINDYSIPAYLYLVAREKELAASNYRELVERSQKIIGDGPFDREAVCGFVTGLNGLGRRKEALVFLRNMEMPDIESVTTCVKLYEQFTDNELTAEDRDDILELRSRLVEEFPTDAVMLRVRSRFYLQRGQFEKALEDANRMISLEPDVAGLYQDRGVVYSKLKDLDNVIKDFSEAIRLAPNNTVTINGIAWLLATIPNEKFRNGEKAVEFATRACELTKYQDPALIDTLAAAYAETGNFEEAVNWQQKAIVLAKDSQLVDELRRHLASYQAGQPWRMGDDEPSLVPTTPLKSHGPRSE